MNKIILLSLLGLSGYYLINNSNKEKLSNKEKFFLHIKNKADYDDFKNKENKILFPLYIIVYPENINTNLVENEYFKLKDKYSLVLISDKKLSEFENKKINPKLILFNKNEIIELPWDAFKTKKKEEKIENKIKEEIENIENSYIEEKPKKIKECDPLIQPDDPNKVCIFLDDKWVIVNKASNTEEIESYGYSWWQPETWGPKKIAIKWWFDEKDIENNEGSELIPYFNLPTNLGIEIPNNNEYNAYNHGTTGTTAQKRLTYWEGNGHIIPYDIYNFPSVEINANVNNDPILYNALASTLIILAKEYKDIDFKLNLGIIDEYDSNSFTIVLSEKGRTDFSEYDWSILGTKFGYKKYNNVLFVDKFNPNRIQNEMLDIYYTNYLYNLIKDYIDDNWK